MLGNHSRKISSINMKNWEVEDNILEIQRILLYNLPISTR